MKTHDYHANIVRYIDKKGYKSIIEIEDKYDKNGLLKQIHFNYVGVAGSSGQQGTTIYDFEKITVNGEKKELNGKTIQTKEELKDFMLDYFNSGKKVTLICAKENCNNPDCRPQINIGNKIQKADNTKRPYFSSHCNGMNYGESLAHLNAKISIHKYLAQKQLSYARDEKSTTRIENLEIEKTFSYGHGQERRADVYYEKHYKNFKNETVIEKFAIEVQRSNITYAELSERTNWYKQRGITTFWIVVDSIFNSNPEKIDMLKKENFNLPLLELISFSMDKYNGRFYIYDDLRKKIIPLTVQNQNINGFNQLTEVEKKEIKTKFSTDNLYIVSNIKEDEKNYQLLPYKEHRNSYNVGVELTTFGVFNTSKDLKPKLWNNTKKVFEYVFFKSIGKDSVENNIDERNIPNSGLKNKN